MIDILLATYNGEKYIASQIYSLLAQTYKDWKLYVADDGSTDDTLDIIRSIMGDDDRLNIIYFEEPVKNAGKNFWRLLSYSKSDYVIFCDQDDIWLENKLANLVLKSKEWKDKNKPNLVFCDAYKYKEVTGKIVSYTLYPLSFLEFDDFIFHNGGYQGCSILFNKALRDKALNYYDDFYIHDEIISLLAHTFGEVLFLNKSLMLYRIHNYNVIGAETKNIVYNQIIKIINRSGYVIHRNCYQSKMNFYNFFEEQIPDDKKSVFQKYFQYCNKNKLVGICLLLRDKKTSYKIALIIKTLLMRKFNI